MPKLTAEPTKSEHDPSTAAHSLCCSTFHFPRYHNPDEIASRSDVGVLQNVGNNRSNYTVSQPRTPEPKKSQGKTPVIQLLNNYAICPVEHNFPIQKGALHLQATNKNTPSFFFFFTNALPDDGD